MQLTDCHTHTCISPDSEALLTDMIRKAQDIGLFAYAVTDHVELCRWYPQGYYAALPRNEEDFFDYAARFEQAMAQNAVARELTQGMTFVSGIELGEPDADFGLAASVCEDKRLDFVIASLHELPGKLDFYFLDYAQEDVPALLREYFTELLKIAEWGKFDVLGHITYPLRYIEGDAGIPVDMAQYRDIIAEIFRAVIRQGKGIELNTSGFRQVYGKPFPDAALLRLYRELGGRILTLGSDAHRPEDVGGGIAQGAALAKSVGFDRIAVYRRHDPCYLTI
ncbi:MAG: histidinol-phosphatase HisJ family protein [Oscillospiraceae bacterium]|nr:histidinol-phosphatase HisJ family protein [Oscillospiraceae bacterium]